VFALGVLAEFNERAYSKGQMANIILESTKVSIRGVIWDETLSRMRSGAGIPTVGSIVAVSARVIVNTRDVEDEEGNVIDTVVTKELMITQATQVPVDDGATSVQYAPVAMPLRRHL